MAPYIVVCSGIFAWNFWPGRKPTTPGPMKLVLMELPGRRFRIGEMCGNRSIICTTDMQMHVVFV